MKDFPFIDSIDLPSDPGGTLSKTRTELAKAYNYNRNSPEKLKLLADTMIFIVDAITKGLGTPDSAEVEAYRMHFVDKTIEAAEVTPGFTPRKKKVVKPKPTRKRAAKRTTKKAK